MNSLPNKDFYNFKVYTNLPNKKWRPSKLSKEETVVVMVQKNDSSNLALLEKILGAVQKELNKDCIVIQEETAVAFTHVLQVIPAAQQFLVFGWKPKDIGLHLQLKAYQPVKFRAVQLLFAPSLNTVALNENKEKQQLWAALQQLF